MGILFIFFWASSLFNAMANIYKLEFPWIRVFDPYRSSKLTWSKIVNAYQWWFIILAFICILWYIMLVVFWLILASIIKSQAYMVATASGVVLIFLLYSLNREFNRIWWDSQRKCLRLFTETWNLRLQLIVKKMVKYIAERSGTVIEQMQGGIKTSQIVSHEENLKIIEVNLEKVAEENSKIQNFLNLFFSLVHRDARLRTNLEILLLEPPFNFNRYMTQLLCNILFMSRCNFSLIKP